MSCVYRVMGWIDYRHMYASSCLCIAIFMLPSYTVSQACGPNLPFQHYFLFVCPSLILHLSQTIQVCNLHRHQTLRPTASALCFSLCHHACSPPFLFHHILSSDDLLHEDCSEPPTTPSPHPRGKSSSSRTSHRLIPLIVFICLSY